MAIAAATVFSLPAALLALAAALYIGYAIVAEPWYRQLFLGYGVKLMILDVLLLIGLVAAARWATGVIRHRHPPTSRWAAALALAGAVAALLLEIEFWTETDGMLPRGLFLGPCIGWAIVAAMLRPPAPVPNPAGG